jgi:hypothetical protein
MATRLEFAPIMCLKIKDAIEWPKKWFFFLKNQGTNCTAIVHHSKMECASCGHFTRKVAPCGYN